MNFRFRRVSANEFDASGTPITAMPHCSMTFWNTFSSHYAIAIISIHNNREKEKEKAFNISI